MQKLVELNVNPDILVSSKILTYDKASYVYFPIQINNLILIHQNELVKIGTPLLEDDNKTITSSISGVITEIKKVVTSKGVIDAIEIKNDYEEKKLIENKARRSLIKITKDTLNKALSSLEIDLKNNKTLILNAIDDEPYVVTNSFYLLLNSEEFLELLDKLAKTYELKQIIIVVKSLASTSISELLNSLGMYPNISLSIVPNLYLIGKQKFLLEYLGLDEDKTTIIPVEKLYYLNNILKRNRFISDKLITISGNNIKNPSVIKVKIGTKAEEIIKNLIEVKDGSIYYANGLMQGKKVDIKDLVVDAELESIIIMKQELKKKEEKCLNCGLCLDVCPVQINPLRLQDKKVSKKCLRCGLCSYICPVYIDFNRLIDGESDE